MASLPSAQAESENDGQIKSSKIRIEIGSTANDPTQGDTNEKVAILVVHGMGQQVPFETIEGVACRLAEQQKPTVRIVQLNEQRLPRAEVLLKNKDKEDVHVHVYEAYWAPLAEGAAGLVDVSRFLWNAGRDGLKHCFGGKFQRQFFDRVQVFPIEEKAWLSFILAMLIFAALSLISMVIAAVAVSRMTLGLVPNWPSPELQDDLAKVLLAYVVCALLSVGLFGTVNKKRMRGWREKLPSWFLWLPIVTTGVVTIAVAALMGYLLWPGQISLFSRLDIPEWLVVLMWVGAIVANNYARLVVTQYVGDVAVYISAHTVNRFWPIRQAIHQAACQVGQCIYQYKKNGRDDAAFYYDKVIVVGHSLGSVVAYDLLNALLLEDLLAANAENPGLDVADRTKLFLTFGSPLDKTAFIFSSQHLGDNPVREGLATAVQPLLGRSRTERWINIWSPFDIVSGPLDYYGDVENWPDPDACAPIAAHNEYWKNFLLAETLRLAATDQLGKQQPQRLSQPQAQPKSLLENCLKQLGIKI